MLRPSGVPGEALASGETGGFQLMARPLAPAPWVRLHEHGHVAEKLRANVPPIRPLPDGAS